MRGCLKKDKWKEITGKSGKLIVALPENFPGETEKYH
jgi:hypothetical protein